MATNDFQQFAYGGGANVLTQAEYIALTTILDDGFPSGVLPSQYLNKVLRQAATMSALIGDLIVSETGQNAVDDGTTTTLLANLISAIQTASSQTTSGMLCAFAGAVAPTGWQKFPTSQTLVSPNGAYNALAFQVGSNWGGGGSTNAGSFTPGNTYVIETVGTTDFTLIGASANTVGITFTATGVGVGSGNAYSTIGLPYLAAGYTPVMGTPGVLTHGALLAHSHGISSAAAIIGGGSAYYGLGGNTSPASTSSTGGSDNLAAGMGVTWCFKL